jgi:hypothetical protein
MEVFPGLELFSVTASLALPVLFSVFAWDCTRTT